MIKWFLNYILLMLRGNHQSLHIIECTGFSGLLFAKAGAKVLIISGTSILYLFLFVTLTFFNQLVI